MISREDILFILRNKREYLINSRIAATKIPQPDINITFYSDLIDLSKIYYIEGESPLFNNFLEYILHTSYDKSHFYEFTHEDDYGTHGDIIDTSFEYEFHNNEINNYIGKGVNILNTLRQSVIIDGLIGMDRNLASMVRKYDHYILGRVEYNILRSRHEREECIITILKDGRIALGNRYRLYIWNPKTKQLDFEKLFNERIYYIGIISDNKLVINSVIYDIERNIELHNIGGTPRTISPSGKLIVIYKDDNETMLCDSDTLDEIKTIGDEYYKNEKFLDDDRLFFWNDNGIRILHIKDDIIDTIIVDDLDISSRVDIDILLGDEIVQKSFGKFRIWNFKTGDTPLEENKRVLTYKSISPNKIIIAFYGGIFKIFNLRTKQYDYTSRKTSDVSTIAIRDDEIILGFTDGKIGLFNLETYDFRMLRKEYNESIESINMLSDHHFITSSFYGDAKLWR